MSCGCGGQGGTCACCHHRHQSQYIIKIGHIIVPHCLAVMGILINPPFCSHPSEMVPKIEVDTAVRGNVWASVAASHNIVMRPIVHLKLKPLMSRVAGRWSAAWRRGSVAGAAVSRYNVSCGPALAVRRPALSSALVR